MEADITNDYLLRAVQQFKKRFMVISPDFKILAVGSSEIEPISKAPEGRCYSAFYGRSEPCENCAAIDTLITGEPSFIPILDSHSAKPKNTPCRYSFPIRSADALEALVSMDFDIRATESLGEILIQSNAFFKNLLLSSVDGVIAADKSGRIIIFNQAAEEISGYSAEEALNELNIRNVYPADGAREIMRKLRSEEYGGKGKLKSCQVNVLRKDGEVIPISLNAAIVYEDDQEVATIGFFHDLRDSLRMKRELEKTQIQLLQAEKMTSLGKLAAGVAHQINNPLGGVILYTQLVLEEYVLDQKIREDLKRILKDAKRCQDTVKALLEFARQTRHLMQPQNINQAISRTLFLLVNHTIFQNIEIKKEFAATLPQLSGDIHQLNHMFMNIFFNAAQAMNGKGTLTIRTYLLAEHERIGIAITDSGPGISEESMPHIFEPFFSTKEEGEGTGLGLSLVYGIVQNHGGAIRAVSPKGQGATFIIELPIIQDTGKGDDIGKQH